MSPRRGGKTGAGTEAEQVLKNTTDSLKKLQKGSAARSAGRCSCPRSILWPPQQRRKYRLVSIAKLLGLAQKIPLNNSDMLHLRTRLKFLAFECSFITFTGKYLVGPVSSLKLVYMYSSRRHRQSSQSTPQIYTRTKPLSTAPKYRGEQQQKHDCRTDYVATMEHL